jgi:predicted regulator of Ras-like GTPase activity (Roadblock/LC7/MglB family)
MTVADSLQALRDVEGVLGSFVIDDTGALLAKDLPAVFYPELFKDVGPRLLRLREAVEAAGDDPQLFVFRFSEHKLHVRCAEQAIVCALSEPRVNLPALKLALTLVARRVRGEHASSQFEQTVPPPPASLDPGSTLPSMPSPFSVPASVPAPSAPPPSVAPASRAGGPASTGQAPVSSQRPIASKRHGFYRGRPI